MKTNKDRSVDICGVVACERLAAHRGWCEAHYKRWQRTGKPEGRGTPVRAYRQPESERLWQFVMADAESGCWNWTGSHDSAGYAQIGVMSKNTTVRAHIVVYETLVGPVPNGLELDHLCRNRGCVNPGHLEPVTRGENVRRGYLARRAG